MLQLQYGSLLGELVFNHLVHQGYWHTAAAVAQDALAGAKQVSEQDRQVQIPGVLLLLRYQSDCLLQACHLLSEKSVSLSLPAVPCVLLHSMLWQQLANAELTLRAGG